MFIVTKLVGAAALVWLISTVCLQIGSLYVSSIIMQDSKAHNDGISGASTLICLLIS